MTLTKKRRCPSSTIVLSLVVSFFTFLTPAVASSTAQLRAWLMSDNEELRERAIDEIAREGGDVALIMPLEELIDAYHNKNEKRETKKKIVRGVEALIKIGSNPKAQMQTQQSLIRLLASMYDTEPINIALSSLPKDPAALKQLLDPLIESGDAGTLNKLLIVSKSDISLPVDLMAHLIEKTLRSIEEEPFSRRHITDLFRNLNWSLRSFIDEKPVPTELSRLAPLMMSVLAKQIEGFIPERDASKKRVAIILESYPPGIFTTIADLAVTLAPKDPSLHAVLENSFNNSPFQKELSKAERTTWRRLINQTRPPNCGETFRGVVE